MLTVLKLARRGIRASLGRLILTTIAIITGVGFVSGAFILADSIQESLDGFFSSIFEGVDGQVTRDEFFDVTLSDSLVAELAALPEVGRATGSIGSEEANDVIALDSDGEPVFALGQENGPPVLTFSIGENDPGLNLVEGSLPVGSDETALSSDYATLVEVGVGDTVRLRTPIGERDFTVGGLIDVEGGGFGAAFVVFDLSTTQEVLGRPGQVDAVVLGRSQGTEVPDMIAAVEAAVPEGVLVESTEDILEEATDFIDQIITIFRNILLGFAAIAVFVSLFIIYNTFAILVNQRIRQIGMLRAVGATRRQIMSIVVLEAALVGLVGSIIGLFTGLFFAWAIKALFQAGDIFPASGTIISPTTVAAAFLVGTVATVIAALVPALLAARISPVAAMRNERPESNTLSSRALGGSLLVALGALFMGLGFTGTPSDGIDVLGLKMGAVLTIVLELGLGAALIFLGVSALSALAAAPFVNITGRSTVLAIIMLILGVALAVLMFVVGDGAPDGGIVAWINFIVKLIVIALAIGTGLALLLSKLRGGTRAGVQANLARRNAERSPRRTASTAAALTIGIALVSAITVAGESVKSSLTESLEASVNADMLVYHPFREEFDASIGDEIAEIDGVEEAARFRWDFFRTDEDDEFISAFDTSTGTDLVDLRVSDGSQSDMTDATVMISEARAEDDELGVGDSFDVEFPNASTQTLTVVAVFEATNDLVPADFVIDLSLFDQRYQKAEDNFVALRLSDNADSELVQQQALAIVDDETSIEVQTAAEFSDELVDGIGQLVSLINYLLGFALIVAFVGVINTIALSVVERTREIGLLRAIGTQRKQIRSIVRWEAVIVCLFGAVLGIGLGVLFAWAAIEAIPGDFITTIAIPWESFIFTLLVASLAGIIAAILPAFFGARRNILQAIATPG